MKMIRGETLRELGPGEILGEAAIFARAARSASVRAVTDVVALEIDRGVLEASLGLNAWVGVFVRTLAERFLELDRLRRGSPSPPER
jgi:CRP-like cAMP-binding protein